MTQNQEETYTRLCDAGYEYCQTEENGDVIVGKYERSFETSRLLYAITITPSGKYTEINLS